MERCAKHIAIIMDGNGRWAQSLGLPRSAGHKAGSEIIQSVCKAAIELDIQCLTLFGLSCDNLQRPKNEVQYLLDLTCKSIEKYLPNLVAQGVQIKFIGDICSLGETVFEKMKMAMETTKANNKLILVIAMNFSGSWHICHTTKKLLKENRSLNDDEIKKAYQSLLPSAPDILIRTGGEYRLSDFVMFHLAYSELFFLDVKWPDFEQKHMVQVLEDFNKRERRYGGIKEPSV